MKYAIVIPDGCADEPQEALGGKTPLEAAHTPAMDAIVAAGITRPVPRDGQAGIIYQLTVLVHTCQQKFVVEPIEGIYR